MARLAEEFEATIQAEGLWAAMRWMNDRVPYRFTAIFAFEGDIAFTFTAPVSGSASRKQCSTGASMVIRSSAVINAITAFPYWARMEFCSALRAI